MNQPSYFGRLTSSERRFVVAVGLALFVVINLAFVRPHFSDWGKLQTRLGKARADLKRYQDAIAQEPAIKVKLAPLEGAPVPPEDQTTEFLRTIQMQAAQNGVQFIGSIRPFTRTNDPFFLEQLQTVTVQAAESNLVQFLYNMGSGSSLISTRSLAVHPDPSRQQLNASITFVASYTRTPPVAPRTAAAAAAQPKTPQPKAPPAKTPPPKTAPAKTPPAKAATLPPPAVAKSPVIRTAAPPIRSPLVRTSTPPRTAGPTSATPKKP